MRRPFALYTALAATLVASTAACRPAGGDAATAARTRYEGHTVAEWWTLRRDPDDATALASRDAMHMLGPTAVPFLAEKAASHDLGDMIGGSGGLETMCPNALPAMEAARSRYPSAALEAAIRRVKTEAPARVAAKFCTADGKPAHADGAGRGGM